MASIDSVFP